MGKGTRRTARQPRPDPGARRPGEQPQERQRRDPQAPAHGVHGGVGLGQDLARLRHDRRRVAAADQRDLPARSCRGSCRTLARPDVDVLEGSPRRSSSTRSGWARTRARRSARPPTPTRCCASCSAGSASRTSARRRRSRSTSPRSPARAPSPSRRAAGRPRSAARSRSPAACARGARASATVSDIDLTAALRRAPSRSPRARSRSPATAPTAGWCASSPSRASSTPTSRSRTSRSRSVDDFLYKEPTKVKIQDINITYEGLIPKHHRSRSCPRTSTRCSRTSAPSSSGPSPSPPAPTATARA